MKLTTITLQDLFIEAADTLKKMPKDGIRNRLTYWPEVVRSSAEMFQMQQYARNTTAKASPDAITRMDAVLTWLLPLDMEERRIILARACGVPWRKLEDMDGRSHTTLRKVQTLAFEKILKRLHIVGGVAAAGVLAQTAISPENSLLH